MDVLDRKILDIIQKEIPIEKRPFKTIGEQIGLDETEVLQRINVLKEQGIIRRIGGSFDSKKVGYVSTLVAAKVPEDKLEQTATILNRYTGITHNYQRDHEYNLWFTLTASSKQRIEQLLEIIKQETGIQELISLPALKKYKIRVFFKMNEDK
jgi:DNA-binding Lrp family transcriptional regulator